MHGEIRPLAGFDELRACVALQEEVWGRDFSERVPVAILRASQRLGGVVAGSFSDAGELEGFVFGLTGIEDGDPVHWSDMLAVRPRLRGAGLGRALKLHQRQLLLARGVRRVYWTFDPLEAGNAWLNIERLGVVVREYIEDAYGNSDSPLHEGIGTDRFVALWLLDSARVVERTEGERRATPELRVRAMPALEPVGEGMGSPVLPRPGVPHLGLEGGAVTVAIPPDIQVLKKRDPFLARVWREATRAALTHYLGRGWEVCGLGRDEGVVRYRLEPMREPGRTD